MKFYSFWTKLFNFGLKNTNKIGIRNYKYGSCGNLRCVGLLGNVLGLLGMLRNVLGMPWQRPRHACNVLGLLGMLPARS